MTALMETRFSLYFNQALSESDAFKNQPRQIERVTDFCNHALFVTGDFSKKLEHFAANCLQQFPAEFAERPYSQNNYRFNSLQEIKAMLVSDPHYHTAIVLFLQTVSHIVQQDGLQFSPAEKKAFNLQMNQALRL